MPTANLSHKLPSLGSIIDRQPLIVPPALPVAEVISLMSQAKGRRCLLSDPDPWTENLPQSIASNEALEISAAARHSSVLVITDNRLVGIFTERDLVKLTASQADLQNLPISDVVTTDIITLVLSDNHTVMTALVMFQQHQIRHLPILDDRQQPIGIVTPDHIRQVLQPVNLLKFKLVSEGMTENVIHALPTMTVLEITQIMAAQNIGSIVIVDELEQLKPVGIITERDIVQFQAFELDLDQLLAQSVMSSPLFCLQSTDSLWSAQQIMQTKNIRRLVITNNRDELQGILTQSNLLQLLDPSEMLYMLDDLQSQLVDRTTELEQINRDLQAEVASREQVEAELRLFSQQLERERERFLGVGSDLQLILGSNGYFHWVSPAFKSALGWTTEEMKSCKWTEFLHPDDVALSVAEATSSFSGKEIIAFENRYRHKDGSYHWLSWNAQPYPEEQLIYAVAVDATEKKSLEEQFLRAQRLESLGNIASGIAHDLNNVLTPIVGAAQLLPMTLPNLDARNQGLLNMLVESSRRGSSLVKQILTFAKGMNGEQTVLQVRHILTEIINVAKQTFPKSIKINLNTNSADLWLVSVDATQIHQVLMNLFVNARDAMPHGGQISVSTENIVIDPVYAELHHQLLVGSYILITIADTGIGMNSETLEKIFDPFFTTKDTGTGLGLSTVFSIIKNHGGSIDVESEVGYGTCFKIYLPAINSREADPPALETVLYDGKGQLVLIVDDEVAVRKITKLSLETYNYRVLLASDGIEAITIYSQNQDGIAIVLVDMMMPRLDTPSIILVLKQINPHVQIIVMSGSSLPPDIIVGQQQVKAILTKPFTSAEMLQTLENIQNEE
jgi:PAS domain S-box-containing protein